MKEEIKTPTWGEIINEILAVQEHARINAYRLWFRGQRRAQWPLMSSLHRRIEANVQNTKFSCDEGVKVDLLYDTYKTLFNKYKSRAWHLLTTQEMSDWGIVFSMQHHGVPTRLLDWTESFICALYFANLGRQPSDDAAIFLLSPEHLNHVTLRREGLVALGEDVNIDHASYHPRYLRQWSPLHTIAVYPIFTNPRMVAQQSMFTIAGDPFRSLEQQYPSVIKKIILPAATYEDSERYLTLAGSKHFSYFPDLGGLKDDLIAELDREVETIRELQKAMAAGGTPTAVIPRKILRVKKEKNQQLKRSGRN